MKNKVLSILLIFSITFALLPTFITTAQSFEGWQSAYAEFLGNKTNYIIALEDDFTGFHFSLYDYDNDGIPELFIHLDWFTSPNDSVLIYTYKNKTVSFIDELQVMGIFLPVNNNFKGIFIESGRFPDFYTKYHEMINGSIKSTLVSDIEHNIWDDIVTENIHDEVLYTEWKNIVNLTTKQLLDTYEITTTNIEKHILSSTSMPSINKSQSTNRHFYAKALEGFLEDAKGFKAAFLIDDKVFAIKEEPGPIESWSKYNDFILAVFAIENGENIKVEYGRGNQEYVGDFTGLSITANNYLYTGGEEGYGIIYEYNNGKLTANMLFKSPWEIDVYEFNDAGISEKQYKEYIKKYGLDKPSKIKITDHYYAPRVSNNTFDKEIGEILAMTAEPSTITVNPTASTIYVNGKNTAFEAYLINGNNYFKLRDLAMAVSGSNKQFEIGYDNATRAITMTSNHSYTPNGGEMGQGDGSTKTATLNSNINITKDGTAIEITSYLIEGNNFIKLRDLMKLFNVSVGYDNKTKVITIDTSKPYTD